VAGKDSPVKRFFGNIIMPSPACLVLRSPGTNCDNELAFAFEQAGAIVERLHIERLRDNPKALRRFEILAIPGGFSYGDDIAAGKILACQLVTFLGDVLREFRDRERLILGVCNGFQALLKAGLLIQTDDDGPLATLTENAGGRFEDRWVHLAVAPGKCPFLADLQTLFLPVAHGEGNFRCRSEWICQGLEEAGHFVLRYADSNGRPTATFPDNPNGSQAAVAGICDPTGQVLGLMPHPERHVLPIQHPRWTRDGVRAVADGAAIFRNAVTFFS